MTSQRLFNRGKKKKKKYKRNIDLLEYWRESSKGPQRGGPADVTLEEKLRAEAVNPGGQQALREVLSLSEYPRWVGVVMRGSGCSQWCPVQWAQIELQKIKQFGNWVIHSGWPCFEKGDPHDPKRFLRNSPVSETAVSSDCVSSSEIPGQRYLVVFLFSLYTCLFFYFPVLVVDRKMARSCSDLSL